MKEVIRFTTLAVLVLISIFRTFISVSTVFSYLLSPLTPVVLILLGFLYKILNRLKYPTGVVLALIAAFYSLNYICYKIWFVPFALEPTLTSLFQVFSAIGFLFPTILLRLKNKIPFLRREVLSNLVPFELRGVSNDVQVGIKPNWATLLQVYLFTVAIGLLSAALVIYGLRFL